MKNYKKIMLASTLCTFATLTTFSTLHLNAEKSNTSITSVGKENGNSIPNPVFEIDCVLSPFVGLKNQPIIEFSLGNVLALSNLSVQFFDENGNENSDLVLGFDWSKYKPGKYGADLGHGGIVQARFKNSPKASTNNGTIKIFYFDQDKRIRTQIFEKNNFSLIDSNRNTKLSEVLNTKTSFDVISDAVIFEKNDNDKNTEFSFIMETEWGYVNEEWQSECVWTNNTANISFRHLFDHEHIFGNSTFKGKIAAYKNNILIGKTKTADFDNKRVCSLELTLFRSCEINGKIEDAAYVDINDEYVNEKFSVKLLDKNNQEIRDWKIYFDSGKTRRYISIIPKKSDKNETQEISAAIAIFSGDKIIEKTEQVIFNTTIDSGNKTISAKRDYSFVQYDNLFFNRSVSGIDWWYRDVEVENIGAITFDKDLSIKDREAKLANIFLTYEYCYSEGDTISIASDSEWFPISYDKSTLEFGTVEIYFSFSHFFDKFIANRDSLCLAEKSDTYQDPWVPNSLSCKIGNCFGYISRPQQDNNVHNFKSNGIIYTSPLLQMEKAKNTLYKNAFVFFDSKNHTVLSKPWEKYEYVLIDKNNKKHDADFSFSEIRRDFYDSIAKTKNEKCIGWRISFAVGSDQEGSTEYRIMQTEKCTNFVLYSDSISALENNGKLSFNSFSFARLGKGNKMFEFEIDDVDPDFDDVKIKLVDQNGNEEKNLVAKYDNSGEFTYCSLELANKDNSKINDFKCSVEIYVNGELMIKSQIVRFNAFEIGGSFSRWQGEKFSFVASGRIDGYIIFDIKNYSLLKCDFELVNIWGDPMEKEGWKLIAITGNSTSQCAFHIIAPVAHYDPNFKEMKITVKAFGKIVCESSTLVFEILNPIMTIDYHKTKDGNPVKWESKSDERSITTVKIKNAVSVVNNGLEKGKKISDLQRNLKLYVSDNITASISSEYSTDKVLWFDIEYEYSKFKAEEYKIKMVNHGPVISNEYWSFDQKNIYCQPTLFYKGVKIFEVPALKLFIGGVFNRKIWTDLDSGTWSARDKISAIDYVDWR